MNKKGQSAVIFIFMAVVLLLALAFGLALLTGITNNFFDEVTPTLTNLGVVEGNGLPGDNMSQNAAYVLNPANTIVNSMSWVIGLGYALCLIGIVAMSVTFRVTGEKWTIALFFLLLVLGLMLSIVISNSYQDLYESNDVIGTELQSMTLISWLILNSPLVTLIVMLLSALVMFTGLKEELI